MLPRFRSRSHEQTVVFGEDHLTVLAGLEKRGRDFIVSTPGHAPAAEAIAQALGQADVWFGARMHTPVAVTEAALDALSASGAGRIIAIGGGSAIGLGKALALRTGLPQVAIPTTYAGSEMTPVLGQTEAGRKTTVRDERVRPGTVIYDVALTLGLPPAISAASGLNGMAHALEALYAPDRTPLTDLAARQAIALMSAALPVVVASPGDGPARAEALQGAWLAGFVLGQTTMGLHHKLAHVLGGMLDLPHAQTHAVLLPHVAGFNAEFLAPLLGPAPGASLAELARSVDAPRSLRELGMKEADIEAVVDEVAGASFANPRPVEPTALRALLEAAWSG